MAGAGAVGDTEDSLSEYCARIFQVMACLGASILCDVDSLRLSHAAHTFVLPFLVML